MLGRRIGRSIVRMVQSLVLRCLVAAFALSILSGTAGLLPVIAPAPAVSVLDALRPRPAAQSRPAGGKGSGSGRQRRDGKKHT